MTATWKRQHDMLMLVRTNILLIYGALALSAASALLYEVAATQLMFFYFVESSRSFAAVISAFLFGLGIGSYLVHRFFSHINDKRLWFACVQGAAAVYAALVLPRLSDLLGQFESVEALLLGLGILFVPAVFLGAAFPLIGALVPTRKEGEKVGLIYAVDLFGAIAGSLAAGFILLPSFGIDVTISVGVALNLAAASVLLAGHRTKLAAVVGIGCVGYVLLCTPLVSMQAEELPPVVHFSEPSAFGQVEIRKDSLFIDNWEQCSASYARGASERKMADYALAAQSSKTSIRVLNIGLGCGLTASEAIQYPRVRLDIVEINPVVVEANRLISDILSSERVALFVDDGLHHMRTTAHTYNAILIDVEDPRAVHSSNLYTVEAFSVASKTLEHDGALAFWTFAKPDGDPALVSRYKDVLYYSLHEIFPFVYEYPGVFLATKQPLSGAAAYAPTGDKELNTIDKNILGEVFPEMIWSNNTTTVD